MSIKTIYTEIGKIKGTMGEVKLFMEEKVMINDLEVET